MNSLNKSLAESLFRLRMVENEISKRYSHQEMRCPVHLSIGQEAVAVGVCKNLEKEDQVYSTHRCHSHYLAKGGNLQSMISEIYGKKSGCCGGRGGSMHLMDISVGMMLSLPIVASVIPIAVGAAMSKKINKSKTIVVVFFGDAAVEEGVFHESANFASLHNLPILFVCENNFASEDTSSILLFQILARFVIHCLCAFFCVSYFFVFFDSFLLFVFLLLPSSLLLLLLPRLLLLPLFRETSLCNETFKCFPWPARKY